MSSNDLNERPFSGPNRSSECESNDSDFEDKSFGNLCSECKKPFSNKFNLRRHFSSKHPEKDLEPKKEFKFPCKDCSCKFNSIYNLKAHERAKHGKKKEVKKLHKCFMCSMELEKLDLIKHYADEHDIDTTEESLSFSTYEEAIKWKEDLEKNDKTKFIVERRTKKNAEVKRHYFKCHRSGYYNSKSVGCRHPKIQGSKKTNFLCPSSIRILEAADGSCKVRYVKTHIGHKMVERVITLDKGKVSTKLKNLRKRHKESIQFDTIINDCKDGWNVLSSKGEEIYLVKKIEKVCNSDCKLLCTYCEDCIHSYQCSCPENAIKWNMCKHIHKVCMFRKKENSSSMMDESGDLNICENMETEFLLKQLKKPISTSEPIENDRSKLKKEYNEIIDLVNKQQLEYMKKNLSHLKAVLSTMGTETSTPQFPSSNENVSSTKKIEPQRRFSSKKRKLNNSVNMMPSAEERVSIF